jgi:membrane-associated protease RseP (regulator of RpoE activity)
MFATALNLLPGGQLDGGHIVFSIAPRAHRWISWGTTIVLLFMAYYFSYVWLMWAVLLRLSSLRHPQVAEWPRVSGGRIVLAGFAVLMLVLTVMPTPLMQPATANEPVHHFSLREILHQLPEIMREIRSK